MPNLILHKGGGWLLDADSDITLGQVPPNCEVYLLYVPGFKDFPDLRNALTSWGQKAGQNLFVGFVDPSDPNYKRLATVFNLTALPSIVMTAKTEMATIQSADGKHVTAFTRYDSPTSLADTGGTMDCLQILFGLVIQGKVAEALRQNRGHIVGDKIRSALEKINAEALKLFKEWGVSIDLFNGSLRISPPQN